MSGKINNFADFCREYGNFLEENDFAPGSGIHLKDVSVSHRSSKTKSQCNVDLAQISSNSSPSSSKPSFDKNVVYKPGHKYKFVNQCKDAFSKAPIQLQASINRSIQTRFSKKNFSDIKDAFRSHDVKIVFETDPVYSNRRARVMRSADDDYDSAQFNLLELDDFKKVTHHESGHFDDDQRIDDFFPGYLDALRNAIKNGNSMEVRKSYLTALAQSYLTEEEKAEFDAHLNQIDQLNEAEMSALLTDWHEAIRYGEEILDSPDYTAAFAENVKSGTSDFNEALNRIEDQIKVCNDVGKVSYQVALALAFYDVSNQWCHLRKIESGENSHWDEKLETLIKKHHGLKDKIEFMKLLIIASYRFRKGDLPLQRVEPSCHV